MPSDLSILKSQLAKYISTLHETSYDNSDDINVVYLCDSNMKVYNFDNITQDKFPPKTSSFDALYFIGNEVYCIEFKNSYRQQLNKKEKKEKNTRKIC